MNKKYLLVLLPLLMLTSCGSTKVNVDNKKINVVIESGETYKVTSYSKTITRGNDVSFNITLDKDQKIEYVSYSNYEIEQSDNNVVLTLKDVNYSIFVSIKTTYKEDDPSRPSGYDFPIVTNAKVTYHFEDSERTISHSKYHFRTNTLPYHKSKTKDGYALIGYKDELDNVYGLGSRMNEDVTSLYPVYVKESPQGDFLFTELGSTVQIDGYKGSSSTIVIPNYINSKPVRTIKERAFEGVTADKLIINESCRNIEKEAFINTSFTELYLYDSLQSFNSDIFDGNTTLKTVHINVAIDPSFSGTYYNTFEDKMDRLINLKDKNKIVLFSGSSARFGYDSKLIDESFEDYDVVNMGVFAYSNTLPEFEMVRHFLKENDIFLEAPEFDTVKTQFATYNEIENKMFNMCESNYDLISLLDYQNYTNFFGAFREFINERHQMEKYDYEDSPCLYDEDRNPYGIPTYNKYGDFTFFRPNGPNNYMHTMNTTDYTINSITEEATKCLDRELKKVGDLGVKVFFDFAPRNISSLSEESTLTERAKVQTLLENTLSVPVIGNIEESLYESKYFYEIDNHLSTEGVSLRTKKAIEHLKSALKNG